MGSYEVHVINRSRQNILHSFLHVSAGCCWMEWHRIFLIADFAFFLAVHIQFAQWSFAKSFHNSLICGFCCHHCSESQLLCFFNEFDCFVDWVAATYFLRNVLL